MQKRTKKIAQHFETMIELLGSIRKMEMVKVFYRKFNHILCLSILYFYRNTRTQYFHRKMTKRIRILYKFCEKKIKGVLYIQ